LQRKQPERDMQNVDFDPPGKISADVHERGACSISRTRGPKLKKNTSTPAKT